MAEKHVEVFATEGVEAVDLGSGVQDASYILHGLKDRQAAADVLVVFASEGWYRSFPDDYPRLTDEGPKHWVCLVAGSVGDVRKKAFDYVGGYTTNERRDALVRFVVSEFISDELAATVARYTLPDTATTDDALGFAPYVNAVAAFLLDPGTQPPLTMSVEGAWGSGKSSFMLQLRKVLEEKKAVTIGFNAWRHEKAEQLWAAFAIHFIRELKGKRNVFRRMWGETKLTLMRFDWGKGGQDVARALLLLAAYAVAAVEVLLILWKVDIPKPLAVSGTLAWVGAAIPIWRALTRQLHSGFEINLRKHLKSPDYDSKVAFLEKFHEDLGNVINAFSRKGEKIFVFIDDVDRCDVPHAAELMKAINLMLGADDSDSSRPSAPALVFIIGMDREKVAAGLAVKNEKLLPYLTLDTPRKERLADALQGLAFGYNFIEKFIQVPFVLPEPRATDLEALLKPKQAVVEAAGRPEVKTEEAKKEEITLRSFVTLDVGADSPNVIGIATMVAPALDHNPRRIKQFVNLFRLRATIAHETGLFRAGRYEVASKRLTLQKLGKFVALELRWPLLLAHLEQEKTIIADLEKVAMGEPVTATERVTYWTAYPQLLALLRAGCMTDSSERDEAGIAECGLGQIDLRTLMRVSPKAPPLPPPEPPLNEPYSDYSDLEEDLAAKMRDVGRGLTFKPPPPRSGQGDYVDADDPAVPFSDHLPE